MTHQPNNVSAAGVLLPESPEAFALRMLVAGGLVSQEKVDSALRVAAKFRAHDAGSAQATGQAPIYQTCFMNGQWRDVDRFEYERAKSLRSDLARIVYAAPSPAAREAGDGVTLTDGQAERIARELLAEAYEERGYKDGPYPSYAGLARGGEGAFTMCSIRAIKRALLREAGSR